MVRRSPALLTLPALAMLGLLFFGGLAFAVAQSFGWYAAAGDSRFTLEYYRAVLTGSEFLPSLALTLWVSAASTALSAICALLVAMSVRSLAARSGWPGLLLQIPIAVPHLAMVVAVIHLIAPSGLVARVLYSAGLLRGSDEFPALLNDGYGIGIIAVYLLKETPFLAVVCLTVLLRVDKEFDAVARTLGASAWQRFGYVTLPLVAPALGAGSILVFAFVFSAFEVPWLMGRPFPALLGVVAQRKFFSSDLSERPEAMAIATVTALVAIAAVWGCSRLQRRFFASPV